MAIRFSTSSLNAPNYSSYTINKFNGVDYTTTPTQVDDSRAINISNYVPKGNALAKREGFISVISTNDTIYNIWEYKDLYIQFREYNGVKCLTKSPKDYIEDINVIHSFENLEDTYSWAIEYEKRLFIFIANDYFVYNGETLEKVSDIAYIPLLCKSSASYSYFGDFAYAYPNNKLENIGTTLIEDLNLLSTFAFVELEITPSLHTNSEIPEAESWEELYYYEIPNIENFEIINPSDEEKQKLGIFNISIIDKYLVISKNVYDKIDNSKKGTLKLKLRKKETNNTIQKMRFGLSYGINGNQDVLFVSGNPNFPNIDYYSSNKLSYQEDNWKTYTYFPDTNFRTFGSSDSAIMGYGILNNGYQAIFKNKSNNNNSNLYLSYGNINTYVDTYGFTQVEVTYPVITSGLTINVNDYNQIIHYSNYLLINAENGIYTLNLTPSTSTNKYDVKETSYYIREELGSDTKDSTWAIYDNKLYISRKNKNGKMRIFVADKDRYSYINNELVFEWWVLDGIEPTFIKTIDNNLYFHIANIGLCRLENGSIMDYFTHKTNSITIGGETINSELSYIDGYFVLNPNSFLLKKIHSYEDIYNAYVNFKKFSSIKRMRNGGFAIPTNDYKIVYGGHYEDEVGDSTYIYYITCPLIVNGFNLSLLFNANANGSTMIAYDGEFGYFVNYTIEIINDIDYITMEIHHYEYRVNSYHGLAFKLDQNNFMELYTYFKGNYLPLNKCRLIEGVWYYLGENEDDFINITTYDDNGNNITQFNCFKLSIANDIELQFVNLESENVDTNYIFDVRTPIESYWYGKYTDLGSLNYLKSANNITFVPDNKIGGFTNVGYRTLKNDTNFASVRKNSLSFDNIDFDMFNFGDTDFAKSYSSKKKIKNFAFIQLKIYSNNEYNSSVVSISFRYKITKLNKGVK